MLTAWGDESGSQPDADPDTYIVAAALIEEDDVELVRKTMSGLLLPTEKKVHWHGSSEVRRFELIQAVAELPICSITVVHHSQGAKDRRGRRKCLEYILPHLSHLECSGITMESRGPKDNSDLDIVQKFRARKVIDDRLRMRFQIGRTEPVLSVPDVVCGAVVQHRVGNPAYLDLLRSMVEIHEI
ncbi:hypothetical protein [Nocardia arizonensis]|uniref:hypothetical protein n=1 Tax=Nocardia arizonensis TaxID=1141647 RepID=UPI0006D0F8FE|nr:hypothetical protein [Nocardia arizonensis]